MGNKFAFTKSVKSALAIFLGVFVANVGTDFANLPHNWAFWQHMLATSAFSTFFAELRYILAWLKTDSQPSTQGDPNGKTQ